MPAGKPLKTSEFLRFLAAKSLALRCDVCGANNFAIHNEVDEGSRVSAVAFKFPGAEIQGAGLLELVMLGCRDCGKVQFFSREPIVAWCDQNPLSKHGQ
jgi:hypothetical protein